MANAKVFNPFTGTFDIVRDSLADLTTKPHSALSSLTSGDDHTQYPLSTGRTGGQTLSGSDTASQSLVLQSNTATPTTSGRVQFGSMARFNLGAVSTTGSPLFLDRSGTSFEFTSGGGAFNALDLGAGLTYRTGTTGVPIRVLSFSPGVTLEAAKTSAQLFLVQPTISPNTVTAAPTFGIRAMIIGPTFATPTLGNATCSTLVSVDIGGSLNSDATYRWINAGTWSCAKVNAFTGTWSHATKLGGNLAGLHVQGDNTAHFTNQMSVYSEPSGVHMWHAGWGIFGSAAAAPTTVLQVAGPIATAISAIKVAAYPITATDDFVPADATAAAFNVTLPTAVGIAGREYTVKKVDASANAVTVVTTGGQTIDGAANWPLPGQWDAVTVKSDNANWYVCNFM